MSNESPRRIKIACPSCGQKLDMTGLIPFSRINCPACSFELIVPKWFNNYLLESPEGAGGMAVVYRALDLALDREVAIKVFDPELASKGVSPDLFLHEARIAATVNHPAVVPIYSCGECEGSAYIVMEYMSGGTLEQRLRKAGGRLPMMETCRWIRDVCEGLGAARANGIVHHDIKPANILLDIDSNAKISDFGLSRAASGAAASSLLDPSTMWVSPQYVSPEKVLTGEEGPEGDVYSLGASFYHLLSGEPPFRSDNVRELLSMRTVQDPVSPDFIRPDITPALVSVILDMMNRDPAARPSYGQIVNRINDSIRAIMRPAAPLITPAPQQPAAAPQQPADHPRKVLNVPADHVSASRVPPRSSHLTLLLILFFLMCSLCVLVFLPHFVDKRALLDAAPSLKVIYGDLPPEGFPFLSVFFYQSPATETEQALSDTDMPLATRYTAAWVSGMCLLLDDETAAVDRIAETGSDLRSAATRAGTQPPQADAYCLAVLSRRDPNQPPVYFSPEQHARVVLGRLIRSVYDFGPDSLEDGRIPEDLLEQFGEFRNAFRALPRDSWLLKLYGARIDDWDAALSGSSDVSDELEPVFRRLLSTLDRDDSWSDSGYGTGSTISGSPFGSESSMYRSGD